MINKRNDTDLAPLKSQLFDCCSDVQKFIFTLTHDNYAKEEIFQNTIVRAFENLHELRNPERMINWLFEIAKTELSRYFKVEKKWNKFKEVNLEDVTEEDCVGDVVNFLEEMESKREVLDLLNKLRMEYAEVVRAYYIYHVPLVELASIWGVNYNTIKTYHNRALKDLKEYYLKKID